MNAIVSHRLYLLRVLVFNSIKKRYRRSVLGVVWSMLNPLLTMMVQALVFSHVFRRDIENYLLYLISGQILFNFFSESTRTAMNSIIKNSRLLKKIKVPKYMFPLSAVLASLVNLLFSIPALVIIMVVTRARFSFGSLTFVFPLFFMLVFCIGVGMFLSAVAVFFRDIIHLYAVFITLLQYTTPIFYPASVLEGRHPWVLFLNPLYHYIRTFREAIYSASPTAPMHVLWGALFSFGAMLLGLWLFNRKQKKFILFV
ncbi:MAG: ABC transporter permease [Treponema sp.]|nr:ABC transporter permease [Treponema sp.]